MDGDSRPVDGPAPLARSSAHLAKKSAWAVTPGIPSFTDGQGREWELYRGVGTKPPAPSPAHLPSATAGAGAKRMDALSDSEFAASMRLVTRIGDYLYIERNVDVAKWQKVRAEARANGRRKVTDGYVGAAYDGTLAIKSALKTGTPNNLVEPLMHGRSLRDGLVSGVDESRRSSLAVGSPKKESPWGPWQPLGVIGSTDERTLPDKTQWPYRTVLELATEPNPWYSAHCTAQSIWNHTAVSAAHCYWDNESESWVGDTYLMTGMHTKETVGGVYEQNYVYGPIDCYRAYVNSGWIEYSTPTDPAGEWDMAVLDFYGDPGVNDCFYEPGYWQGYLGTSWGNSSNDYYYNYSTMDAYDAFDSQTAGAKFAPYRAPTVMTRPSSWYQLYLGSNANYLESTSIDAVDGASGGSVRCQVDRLKNGDLSWYNVGTYTQGSLSVNRWRRMEPVYWAFVVNSSSEL